MKKLFTAFLTLGLFIGICYVLFSSLKPTQSNIDKTGYVFVNLNKIDWSKRVIFEWQGKPIQLIKRTESELIELEKKSNLVLDYESLKSQTNESLHPVFRSIKPELFVSVAISTHCGCSTEIFNNGAHKFSKHLTDACHALPIFDLAGRKIANDFGSPINKPHKKLDHMLIPPHYYLNKNTLVIGTWKKTL